MNFLEQNNLRWKINNLFCIILTICIGIFIFLNWSEFSSIIKNYRGLEKLGQLESVSVLKMDQEINEKLTDDQLLILRGDKSQESRELQFKPIVDKFPDNKIYYANYVARLDLNDFPSDIDPKELANEEYVEQRKDNQRILKILEHGEKLEPENALYNYLKAYVLFSESIIEYMHEDYYEDYDEEKPKDMDREQFREYQKQQYNKGIFPKFSRKYSISIKIIDEKKLAQALDEYYKAIAKPYLKFYLDEFTAERSRLCFDEIANMEQYFYRLNIVSNGLCLNSMGPFRQLARTINYLSRLEYKKGNKEQAEKLLKTWGPFCQQYSKQNTTLIGALVECSMEQVFLHSLCEYYAEEGNKKQLQYYNKKRQISLGAKQVGNSEEIERTIEKHAGLLTVMLFSPIKCYWTAESLKKELRPERMMWYKYYEFSIVLILAFFAMIFAWIYWIIALLTDKNNEEWQMSPVMMKFSFKEWVKFLSFALILPVVVYLTITHVELLSGREYSFVNAPATVAQMFLLLLFVFVNPVVCFNLMVKNYCRKMAITEEKMLSKAMICYFVALILLIIASLMPCYSSFLSIKEFFNGVIIAAVICGIIALVNFSLAIVFILKKAPSKKIFFINVAPYLMLVILMMSIPLSVLFVNQKNYYFMQDELVFSKNHEMPWGRVEYQVLDYINKEVYPKLFGEK
ncbi:hypothetical protein AAEX28_10340 [Lentisphaerota bacterium WC36G]|nr:hypothetical protein LJT99_13180 [Lentisphaerae bacterium WC36]